VQCSAQAHTPGRQAAIEFMTSFLDPSATERRAGVRIQPRCHDITRAVYAERGDVEDLPSLPPPRSTAYPPLPKGSSLFSKRIQPHTLDCIFLLRTPPHAQGLVSLLHIRATSASRASEPLRLRLAPAPRPYHCPDEVLARPHSAQRAQSSGPARDTAHLPSSGCQGTWQAGVTRCHAHRI
jgi:hypothetical protein